MDRATRSKGKIFLIHWNKAEALSLVQPIESAGWQVQWEAEDGARASKSIEENPPQAIIIYLTRLPSHGRETAHYLRNRASTRSIPILFVDGNPEAIIKTRAKIPDGIFTHSAGLLDAVSEFEDV
jgi:CheY-like chemotaxis protein